MAQGGRKGGRTRGFGDGTEEAIRALIEVHRHLGPGFMESADEASAALIWLNETSSSSDIEACR
jgi:hypothetical protein